MRLTGKTSRFGYYFDYVTGSVSYATIFLGIGLGLDQSLHLTGGNTVGYPGIGGFELEDGIYLVAPIVWVGWLTPFFVAAGTGAVIYCLWTLGRLVRLRQEPAGQGQLPRL